MITVYRYKLFDQRDGEWIVQISKGTKGRIEALGGGIIEGTAEQVDESLIDNEGRYIPPQV
ncbi:hypothetical protein [Rhodoplanes sp. Z2-YC6860]|uniref:hypothetical protein n=1 Tax=Rhodoplanes sp. Z2-YC6860 TaxID=674703 RepID=UPI00082DC54C|nr:hypothetical protein [Rhodoplanes sp. Z2-YC6860]